MSDGSVVAIMGSPQWAPTTTFPSGPVGCLVADAGQGAVTCALYYYSYAGEFRSVRMVTRESEVVNPAVAGSNRGPWSARWLCRRHQHERGKAQLLLKKFSEKIRNPLVTVGLSWFAEEERKGVGGGVERRGIEIFSFLS